MKNENDILSTQNLINDARTRRKLNKNMFQCNICEFKSGSETLLKRHTESMHKQNRHPCDQCDYKANTENDIKRHAESMHKQNCHPCYQCEYKANTENDLKYHIESVHRAIVTHAINAIINQHNKTIYYSI